MKTNTKIVFNIPFQYGVDLAFKTISDPMSYKEIHPLITEVHKIDKNQYECFEITSILGYPYNFKYVVSLNHVHYNLVTMESEVQKGVWIKLSFSIQLLEGEQFLREEIEIKGPYLIQKMLSKKLKKAHHKMFHNLKQKIYLLNNNID